MAKAEGPEVACIVSQDIGKLAFVENFESDRALENCARDEEFFRSRGSFGTLA